MWPRSSAEIGLKFILSPFTLRLDVFALSENNHPGCTQKQEIYQICNLGEDNTEGTKCGRLSAKVRGGRENGFLS